MESTHTLGSSDTQKVDVELRAKKGQPAKSLAFCEAWPVLLWGGSLSVGTYLLIFLKTELKKSLALAAIESFFISL